MGPLTRTVVQSVLPIGEMDAAYRHLMATGRFLSAQQLIWWAINFTDFRLDTNLKWAVRRAKYPLRKIHRNHLAQIDSGPDPLQNQRHRVVGIDTETSRKLIALTDMDLPELRSLFPPPSSRSKYRPPFRGDGLVSPRKLKEDNLALVEESLRVQAMIMDRTGPKNQALWKQVDREKAQRKEYRMGLLKLMMDLAKGKFNPQITSEKMRWKKKKMERRRLHDWRISRSRQKR